MNIKRNLIVAALMTVVTTLLLGVIYPLAITAIAQGVFPHQANGQLIEREGRVIGSPIIRVRDSRRLAISALAPQPPAWATTRPTRRAATSGRPTRS